MFGTESDPSIPQLETYKRLKSTTMSNLIEPQAEDERLLEAKVEDLYQHVRAITPRIPRKKLSATLSLPSHVRQL